MTLELAGLVLGPEVLAVLATGAVLVAAVIASAVRDRKDNSR